MTTQCDKCGKVVKNLKLHYRAAHGQAPDGPGEGGNNPVYSQPTRYVCQACKGAIKEGENPCPHCGATLRWPGQEGEGRSSGTQGQDYHCSDCGHHLRRGMKRCPGCGEDIEWD